MERKNDKISQELARAKNAREREVYDTKIKLEQAEQKTQELEKKIQSMREQIASPHEQVKQIERQERERAKLFTEKVKLEAKVKSLEEKVSLQKVELNETIANSPAKVSSREMQKLKDESARVRIIKPRKRNFHAFKAKMHDCRARSPCLKLKRRKV